MPDTHEAKTSADPASRGPDAAATEGPDPAAARPGVARPGRIVRLPSRGGTAVLAGAMLALGLAIGAAIGPAPQASFAGAQRALLPTLTALAGSGATAPAPQAAPAPAPAPSAATPTAARTTSSHPSSTSSATQESSSPSSSKPSTPSPSDLPPVSHVWLIQLSGAGFGEALAQPSAAPYIDGAGVSAGALLSSWSALEGSAFASDAALVAGTAPQIFNTIVQPPCPEGAAGAQCAASTAGALSAADTFLQSTIPAITSTTAYRDNGLIVVTFASIIPPTETGLPTGAANATLASAPPAGVLLISPFVSAGTRPAGVTFNPASPTQSLEKLLHK